ncbi:MAG: CoA pyrophosphatase [Bacteriovoracia bacterium]
MSDFFGKIRSALTLDLPYLDRAGEDSFREMLVHRKRAQPDFPEEFGQAAVLVVFGESAVSPGAPRLLLTLRTHTVESHKGQVALPGGMRDPEDTDLASTALRETAEEVGIAATELEILGRLPKLATLATGTWITPYLARLKRPIEEVSLHISRHEIEEVFWLPWAELAGGEIYSQEWFQTGTIRLPTHVFRYQKFHIWGATAAILKNLLDRHQQVVE